MICIPKFAIHCVPTWDLNTATTLQDVDLSTSEEGTGISSPKVKFLQIAPEAASHVLSLNFRRFTLTSFQDVSPANNGKPDSLQPKTMETSFLDMAKSPQVSGESTWFSGSTMLGLYALFLLASRLQRGCCPSKQTSGSMMNVSRCGMEEC